MKFLVDADELRVASGYARATVAKAHTAPILANVLIKASDSKITLRTTDTQIELETSIKAEVHEPGSMTVSAAVLHDLAKRLPSDVNVNFVYENNENLKIFAGQTDCDLLTLPPEDFPMLAQVDYDLEFDIDTSILTRLLLMSSRTVMVDSPRKYLQGIMLHQDENMLRCVSSDGFQMAVVDTESEVTSEFPNIILPLKTAQEVLKMLDDGPDTVHVAVSENKIQFSIPQLTFSSRVINDQFPDYKRLIPQSAGLKMDADCKSCLQSLGRLSAVVPREGSAVTLTISNDKLHMSVSSPLSGTINETLDVSYPHEEMKIKFKHDHLTNILNLLHEGTVSVEFQETPGATLFTTNADKNALFILMPIRL